MTPKKMIPWQERDRIGGPQAFVRTTIEALMNPGDYFEKLETQDFYQEPLLLCFYNSLFLTWPLLAQIFLLSNFAGFIFILFFIPPAIFILAFIIKQVISWSGAETNYQKTFYVLAYSSPAFVLALVPLVGYWLCALAVLIIVTIGLMQAHKVALQKILPAVILVPFLVLIPYGSIRIINAWNKTHPRVVPEEEAIKILSSLSVATEHYAAENQGKYPTAGTFLPEVNNTCGQLQNGYRLTCEFRNYGYFFKAQPEGWLGRGKKVFVVTTGGKLRTE